MVISRHMLKKVKQLFKEGKKKSTIAEELDIDRKTVTKYLEADTLLSYQPRTTPKKEDPFKAFEMKTLKMLEDNSNLTANDIFEFLIEQGYSGSERTLRHRVAAIERDEAKRKIF
ncbi:MAG: hypothetical protein HQK51_20015 [Oligoflexia bacterium]|nr:hypothetical protein [Oligoflexia bacterium]